MEENAGDRVRAGARAKGRVDRVRAGARAKGRVDRVADDLAVLSQEAQEAHVYVRNAGIVNLMNAECRACRSSVRSAVSR